MLVKRNFCACGLALCMLFANVPQGRADCEGSGLLALALALAPSLAISANPGTPSFAASALAAGSAAGFPVQLPTWLPSAVNLAGFEVITGRTLSVTANIDLLEEFGCTSDAPGLSGLQTGTVNASPIVQVNFQSPTKAVSLLQAQEPPVNLPDGLSLETLAELKLLQLGFNPGHAQQLAHGVNWLSLLLVPIPPSVQSITETDIRGQSGALIQVDSVSIVLWSANNQIYGLVGNVSPAHLIAIARSVQ